MQYVALVHQDRREKTGVSFKTKSLKFWVVFRKVPEAD